MISPYESATWQGPRGSVLWDAVEFSETTPSEFPCIFKMRHTTLLVYSFGHFQKRGLVPDGIQFFFLSLFLQEILHQTISS